MDKDMPARVLLIGYGSIGRRHVRNLIEAGIRPYVVTSYPDNEPGAVFLKNIHALKGKDIRFCIISSPTARHLSDFKKCVAHLRGLRKVLIEKPLESSFRKAKRIKDIAVRNKLKVAVAYNFRFIRAFNIIRKFIRQQKNSIRIIEIVAGQDLRQWRPSRIDIRRSYSAYRLQGGGVDLDLSHEIDYILWLWGDKFRKKLLYRDKISKLKIDSPDICKIILDYQSFIVDVTLDYIRRPKERNLRIICANGKNLDYNFLTGRLRVGDKLVFVRQDMDSSYKNMLRVFLGMNKQEDSNICGLDQALSVLEVLEV